MALDILRMARSIDETIDRLRLFRANLQIPQSKSSKCRCISEEIQKKVKQDWLTGNYKLAQLAKKYMDQNITVYLLKLILNEADDIPADKKPMNRIQRKTSELESAHQNSIAPRNTSSS